MHGGLAVFENLLCVSFTDTQGRIVLVDLADRRPVAAFAWGGGGDGIAAAGGIAIDELTTIFVADAANHVVRRFTIFGKELGRIGVQSSASRHAQGRDKNGVLNHPRAVALSGDQLVVACGESPLRHGVQRFTRAGEPLPPLRSLGDPEETFGAPAAVAATATEILVADTLRGRIQRFRQGGAFLHAFACGPGADGRARPIGVASLPDRAVLAVLEGPGAGLARYTALGERVAFVADGTAGLEHPLAVAVSPSGAIYVLDRHGERVQRWNPDLESGEVILDLAEYLYGT